MSCHIASCRVVSCHVRRAVRCRAVRCCAVRCGQSMRGSAPCRLSDSGSPWNATLISEKDAELNADGSTDELIAAVKSRLDPISPQHLRMANEQLGQMVCHIRTQMPVPVPIPARPRTRDWSEACDLDVGPVVHATRDGGGLAYRGMPGPSRLCRRARPGRPPSPAHSVARLRGDRTAGARAQAPKADRPALRGRRPVLNGDWVSVRSGGKMGVDTRAPLCSTHPKQKNDGKRWPDAQPEGFRG